MYNCLCKKVLLIALSGVILLESLLLTVGMPYTYKLYIKNDPYFAYFSNCKCLAFRMKGQHWIPKPETVINENISYVISLKLRDIQYIIGDRSPDDIPTKCKFLEDPIQKINDVYVLYYLLDKYYYDDYITNNDIKEDEIMVIIIEMPDSMSNINVKNESLSDCFNGDLEENNYVLLDNTVNLFTNIHYRNAITVSFPHV